MIQKILTLFHLFALLAIGLELLHGIWAEGEERLGGYVVKSSSCRIPDYDPYDDSIAGIPSKWPPFTCNSLPPLTTVTGHYRDSHNDSAPFWHVLHLHRRHFHLYNISQNQFFCCYRLVTRDDSNPVWPDDGFKLSDCVRFTDHVTFRGSEEFIWVKCWEQGPETQYRRAVQYVNMHAFIGYKREASRKISKQNPRKKKLSVMIIGFDSMSRLNLMRTMPKTVGYLSQNGWYEMKGFNKVGDNTLPNIMAALAGLSLSQITASCLPLQYTPMDGCPIIWKKFSERGYVTAYGEDQPIISSFNSVKLGFKRIPTDYYLRPFILAAHNQTELKEIGPILRYQHRIACYGPTKVADHFFNYSLDLLKSYLGYATFSLFWQNGFSHEHLNGPSAMDDTVLAYFLKLAASGVLDHTMIIFMSDHGFRFGPIRETFLGYLEERLPFIYFWVPEKFKKAHPTKIKNLEKNSNRLTSPYDVYMTLLDVLGDKSRAAGCPECRSLFELVPWNRSCADAGIVDHWCTCADYSEIDVNSPLSEKTADLVVRAINGRIFSFRTYIEKGSLCAILQLKKIISVRKKMSTSAGIPQLIVVVQTIPGFAEFEATVIYSGGWNVMDSISRINRYDNQSECADHAILRKFCYCL